MAHRGMEWVELAFPDVNMHVHMNVNVPVPEEVWSHTLELSGRHLIFYNQAYYEISIAGAESC
jgi:hypothetical protein